MGVKAGKKSSRKIFREVKKVSFKIVTLKDILKLNTNLSAKKFYDNNIQNKNVIKLSNLIEKIEKGQEIGSKNYLNINNEFKFIRTSAIENELNYLVKNNKTFVNMKEEVFNKNIILKKDDILLTVDGTPGKVAILDKKYSTHNLCAGIHKLSFKKNQLYIYAIMKHAFFRNQIEKFESGSTIKHVKNSYLNCEIPFPTENQNVIILFIENLVRSILNKEEVMNKKFNEINNFISELLTNNQKTAKNFKFNYPSFTELISSGRLDTGEYSEKFKKSLDLIKRYNNGIYYIKNNEFSSGNTPKKRKIYNDLDGCNCITTSNIDDDYQEAITENSIYNWVTTTDINDRGMLNFSKKIGFKGKNNLNQSSLLIINRTSKGGEGKYIGVASYYDYSIFGKGQHNQGLYRVENYDEEDLIVICCLLNHPIYRGICGEMAVGSKMKELKSINFSRIPFPKFKKETKKEIVKKYYNRKNRPSNLTSKNYLKKDFEWNKEAGLLDVYMSYLKIKYKLNKTINNIYNNEKIRVEYI